MTQALPEVEIEYRDSWFCQIGGTIFCHPMAFSGGIMATAEKARRFFKDSGYSFDALVMAHTHRIGRYDVGDTVIYEQGAACDTSKQHYTDGKLTVPQREGYIYVCQDESGKLLHDYTKLIKLN